MGVRNYLTYLKWRVSLVLHYMLGAVEGFCIYIRRKIWRH